MKRFSESLCLVALIAGMASCAHDDNPWEGTTAEGSLRVDVTTDSRVLMSTRADDTKVSVVPQPSEFAITFEKQDGTFSQSWANVNLFNRETHFPIGTYTLSASYGNMENEGFELPCFSASTDVIIEKGVESHVNLTATLQNTMVSVRYTEDFIGRFTAYSAALKSASGSEFVVFAQNEDRPAYMKPERTTMRLTLTNAQGQSVTVSPYTFTPQPRHHYIITVGVKDSVGTSDVVLDVQITEDVTTEFVDISLGDELFTAPKPMVKGTDFPASMSYEDFEGFAASGDPRAEVLAYGGMKRVNLNVTTASPLVFGNSVQLVNADALTQANIASTGLVAEGFYRNPDKAGVIKFKDFLKKLPVGTYKFTIDVEDVRTLVCDNPLQFTVVIKPVEIQLAVAKHPEYMGEEMTVAVTTNKADVKDNIRFEVTDANEQWVPAEILPEPTPSPEPSQSRTRADASYNYNFRISTPPVEHYDVKVRAFYGSETSPKAEIVDEGVVFPQYRVEVDAFATRALLKIIPTDASKREIIMNKFKIRMNGVENTNLGIYDEAAGIFELTGLSADTEYEGFQTYLSYVDNPHIAGPAFKTEAMVSLYNGSFDAVSPNPLRFSDIQVGGLYRAGAFDYTIKSSIERDTPDGWANLNDLTCWNGASNKNSWFIVPSTYWDNGKVVIETVGYSHNGTTPSRTGSFTNTTYYCENTPSDGDLTKTAGELFLGTYSYDGTEHRADGINWTTRPESLSFIYSYEPCEETNEEGEETNEEGEETNEEGEVYIRLYDAAGTRIASGSQSLSAGKNKEVIIPLTGYLFGKKAAKIVLGFRSTKSGTTPKISIPTGNKLSEGASLNISRVYTVAHDEYHAVAKGSKLTVDDVTLNYIQPEAQNQARRKAKGGKRK